MIYLLVIILLRLAPVVNVHRLLEAFGRELSAAA
jgi:hypothetical protein